MTIRHQNEKGNIEDVVGDSFGGAVVVLYH